MNFQCKELTVSDDELGCTITFSDSISSDDRFKTVDEIMNSKAKYLLIQRTYPEDDYESDYYYLETSETDTEFKSSDIISVTMNQDRFKIDWPGAHLEIGLKQTDKEMKNLEEVLEARFKDRIRVKKYLFFQFQFGINRILIQLVVHFALKQTINFCFQ